MISFAILTLAEIESEILKVKIPLQNFSKTISFPFSERYRNWVTQIPTAEISSETILYNSVEAVNENKEFDFTDYWCFAGNGQGDQWFLNTDDQVFFYNHDYDEKLEPMNINFEEWLQMAFVIRQLDMYFDEYDNIPESVQQEFYKTLNRLHPTLSNIYPFTF
ncbi:SMI1/KNR4 family protein [Chryseobacterium indologenes]|uniref:SMI1/KNR4 family protein n=1 Tax=Chryseobacterium indologenes TaxID=253 RepID=UPI001BCC2696|nr:SMI1/KNR4 family protein [Chryseobacterium indologenes]